MSRRPAAMSEGYDDDAGYEVGYRKPPVVHQFKKGQSGNPKGRPRSLKTPGQIIADVAREKIPMVVNGRSKKVGMLEATLRSVIHSCLRKGNPRDLDHLLKPLERHGVNP